jgi:hypothetical protein
MPYAPDAEARVIPGEDRISAAVLAIVSGVRAGGQVSMAAGQGAGA